MDGAVDAVNVSSSRVESPTGEGAEEGAGLLVEAQGGDALDIAGSKAAVRMGVTSSSLESRAAAVGGEFGAWPHPGAVIRHARAAHPEHDHRVSSSLANAIYTGLR